MRLNPTPPDPTQAMIFTWMPLVFTFFLAHFPAGLVIYWAWNNTLSVTQQYFIMRRYGAEVNLWGNILESLGLRKPQPATAAATAGGASGAAASPKPANDDKPEAEATAEPEEEAPVTTATPRPAAHDGRRKKKKKPAKAKAKG